MIEKAFRTGFHRIADPALPRPVGSSDRITKYRHLNAASSDSAGELWRLGGGECGQVGDAVAARGFACKPCVESGEVDRGGGQDVLHAGLGDSVVAASS